MLLAIGSRIPGRITGGNVHSFARGAKKYMVDVDEAGLQPKLQQVPFDENIYCDAKIFIEKLKKTIRSQASPRHVPSKIIEVNDIPRTKNGKIVELAVKNIIEGNKIKNIQALANPNALKQYKNLKQLKT